MTDVDYLSFLFSTLTGSHINKHTKLKRTHCCVDCHSSLLRPCSWKYGGLNMKAVSLLSRVGGGCLIILRAIGQEGHWQVFCVGWTKYNRAKKDIRIMSGKVIHVRSLGMNPPLHSIIFSSDKRLSQ